MPHPSPSVMACASTVRKEIYLQQIRIAVNGLIQEGLVLEKTFTLIVDVQDRQVRKVRKAVVGRGI